MQLPLVCSINIIAATTSVTLVLLVICAFPVAFHEVNEAVMRSAVVQRVPLRTPANSKSLELRSANLSSVGI